MNAQVVTQRRDASNAAWMWGVARTKLKVPSPVSRHKHAFFLHNIPFFCTMGLFEAFTDMIRAKSRDAMNMKNVRLNN